jgi:hypothetical protein
MYHVSSAELDSTIVFFDTELEFPLMLAVNANKAATTTTEKRIRIDFFI